MKKKGDFIMSYRNGNYAAFYVDEPFNESNLGANEARDFCNYNLLKAWKAKDSDFHFNDSHDKTYDVRDDSDWDKTLKPRLHKRLNSSKNIILFLSEITRNSRALREEIDYGIKTCDLPIIVVYPDYNSKEDIAKNGEIKNKIKNLWDQLPVFRNNMDNVPTLHIPFEKALLKKALDDSDFMVQSKTKNGIYLY
jgi:hypothetical protein